MDDFLDEYELHNLLKRTEAMWNKGEYNLEFGRPPNILFGPADSEEEQQLESSVQYSYERTKTWEE